ncbi:peptidyl-tRNA hydrolase ICT1, mitochondrial [Selaginella moellendorffii]|uniref:peptidyl-tRNA hydrolase ICT1, mitochondrial n=1 Tax=Selaginella moellendorffii TaxID=88036 RepID=UPI000D1CFBD5|nr:peptidyl-tRNA hydrolase ICT1, mitochondrial [Selaginella moellendorffii]|eukprot:XP_024539784.1 peptidyl-tRNA hydrolase ICT1, mitochondrial [Selaginella moellendorffii]
MAVWLPVPPRWPGLRASVLCKAGEKKAPARLVQKQQMISSREEAAAEADYGNQPIPRLSIDHVTVSFARSGGAGGQNVNKVNTKVDMRFNVMNAHWLPLQVRNKLLQTEKNRINSDGELVISSTRTRTQKGNIDDALAKLQELVDAAAYVPPPPSQETKQRIARLAAAEDMKRLQSKKLSALKKSARRDKGSWD